jgi:hypothetical protein
MTDGLSFIARAPETPSAPAALDLNTVSAQIIGAPISVHVGLLELIGNDLYRRHWPTMAHECKQVARDLQVMARYTGAPIKTASKIPVSQDFGGIENRDASE